MLVTSFLAVVGNWLAGATESAVGDRPALVVVLFLIGMAALFVYQVIFEEAVLRGRASGTTFTAQSFAWETDIEEVAPLAQAVQILLAALAVAIFGAIFAMLPIVGSIVDFLRQPLLRIPIHLPWLLFIAVGLAAAVVAELVDAPDGAVFAPLIMIGLLTLPLARPWFGPEHRFSRLVDDAVTWDSQLEWLEGGRATSIVHDDIFRQADSPNLKERYKWAAVDPEPLLAPTPWSSLLAEPRVTDGVYVVLVGAVEKPPTEAVRPPGRDRRAPWKITLTSPYTGLKVDVLYWSKSANPVCPNYAGVVGLPIAYAVDRRHVLLHGVRQQCFPTLEATNVNPSELGGAGKWIGELETYFEVRDVTPQDALDVAEAWRILGVDALAVHADKVPLSGRRYFEFVAVVAIEQDEHSAQNVCGKRHFLDSASAVTCPAYKLDGQIPPEALVKR
ncbi:MAG TPA: hypothetical protein VK988_15635 [Acidimicrobiales bacterium]|nr:hypothetical protein [Acidimicrobiales bacterium]